MTSGNLLDNVHPRASPDGEKTCLIPSRKDKDSVCTDHTGEGKDSLCTVSRFSCSESVTHCVYQREVKRPASRQQSWAVSTRVVKSMGSLVSDRTYQGWIQIVLLRMPKTIQGSHNNKAKRGFGLVA